VAAWSSNIGRPNGVRRRAPPRIMISTFLGCVVMIGPRGRDIHRLRIVCDRAVNVRTANATYGERCSLLGWVLPLSPHPKEPYIQYMYEAYVPSTRLGACPITARFQGAKIPPLGQAGSRYIVVHVTPESWACSEAPGLDQVLAAQRSAVHMSYPLPSSDRLCNVQSGKKGKLSFSLIVDHREIPAPHNTANSSR
jgi:hypothetical protein